MGKGAVAWEEYCGNDWSIEKIAWKALGSLIGGDCIGSMVEALKSSE